MSSEIFEQVDRMLASCEQQLGSKALASTSIVTSAKGAVLMLREMHAMQVLPDQRFGMTNDTDELFQYRTHPVRLRLGLPVDRVMLMQTADVPRATCCDKAAMHVMMVQITTAAA